jgi:hypothetical protein
MVSSPSTQSTDLDEKPAVVETPTEALGEETEHPEEEHKYATGVRLNLIVIGLTLSVLLVALVRKLMCVAK